jgi:hypothetical protein
MPNYDMLGIYLYLATAGDVHVGVVLVVLPNDAALLDKLHSMTEAFRLESSGELTLRVQFP